MRRKIAAIIFAGLIFWARTNGQDKKPTEQPTGKVPADKVIVLKAARMFDGRSGSLVTPGDKIGALDGGKFADVVAVPGDPAARYPCNRAPGFVMKEGVNYKNDSAAMATGR